MIIFMMFLHMRLTLELQYSADIFTSILTVFLHCAWEQKNKDEGGKDMMKKHRRQVLFSGIITAVGMTTLSLWLSSSSLRLSFQ